ncbi:hypothetical protein LMG24238_04266 [Paraburkholderia sediminicola]|uniref:Acyltransferase 3 domain-containing protein n=1 Tax=Paraburkholderia sediminicola TaxID=458836 RepID=A0A6J5BRT9_9BURK|nr:acyltransferase [Paraburkholderia sediminicola]CAB3712334.1 hypothetical protein LMG24238_04266 [Paraburkholderia sediminicola]
MRDENPASVFDGKRNNDIEMLRGVAILFVLADHIFGFWDIPNLQSTLGDYASFWGGVDLFFAISGFVIAQSLLRSMVGLQSAQGKVRALVSFWIKRVWRLWPAAWLWLMVPFIVALIAIPDMQHGANLRANVSFLFGGILNVVNIQEWAYWHHNGMRPLYASPYWSLSLEEQFYLLCAPFLLFVPRKWVIAILVSVIAVQFPMVRGANTDDLAWFIRSDAFAWGVLLSLLSSSRLPRALIEPTLLRRRWFARPLLVFVLASIAVMPQLLYSLPFGVGLIAALSGLLVFIASYDEGYLGLHGFVGKLLSWIGNRSYAIYLVNGAVIALGLRSGPLSEMSRHHLSDLLLMSAVFLVVTLILADVTYRFIEVPARLHGRKLAMAYGNAQPASDFRSSSPVQDIRDHESA